MCLNGNLGIFLVSYRTQLAFLLQLHARLRPVYSSKFDIQLVVSDVIQFPCSISLERGCRVNGRIVSDTVSELGTRSLLFKLILRLVFLLNQASFPNFSLVFLLDWFTCCDALHAEIVIYRSTWLKEWSVHSGIVFILVSGQRLCVQVQSCQIYGSLWKILRDIERLRKSWNYLPCRVSYLLCLPSEEKGSL